MSFQLGKIHIGLSVLSLALFVYLLIKQKLDAECVVNYLAYSILLVLSLFLTTQYSGAIWRQAPQLQYLQFPWRILTFTTVFISMLGGYSIQFIFQLFKRSPWVTWILVPVIIIGTIVQYQKYFSPSRYIMDSDEAMYTLKMIEWDMSMSTYDFIPLGVPLKKSQYLSSIVDISEKNIPKEPFEVRSTNTEVKVHQNDFSYKSFLVSAAEQTTFQLNTFYFPGWVARVDGVPTEINAMNRYKLIRIQVPSGSHSLEFRFEDTPIRRIANAVTVLTVAGMMLSLGIGQLKKRKT